MKARLTIDIDTDDDSADGVVRVLDDMRAWLAWALLNEGSSNNVRRLWAEAQSRGCDIAAYEDADVGCDVSFVMTTRQDIDEAVRFVKEGE